MFEIYLVIIITILTFLLNFFFKKKKIILDIKSLPHKSFVSKDKVPITGGLILIFSFLILLTLFTIDIKIIIFFIFLLGFMSDLNYLKSPIKRFFLQIVILIIFINLSDNFVTSLRIPFFDRLLEYEIFKNIITIFCYMVLINGSNFIDGVNISVLGYFISISIIFYLIIEKFNFDKDLFLINEVLILLSVLFLFNFFGKIFLGDGGVYLIALIYGYYAILLTNLNYVISPYCIAALFWYPAFECLFSIIRQTMFSKSIMSPDNSHLHHLILKFIKTKHNLKDIMANTLTGIIINLTNAIIFYNVYQNISQTKNLILIITLSVILYVFSYAVLSKKLKI